MPRVRRLCDPQGRPADDARDRHAAGKHRVRQRHRLLVALPLLHGDLRLPHDPRPRAGGGDGGQARQSRARRVDHHRRRRRASIGGNHMLHLLRRNLDVQVLLFNNEIYGLTKGQYSPTSRVGTRSPSTPFGSVDRPANPCGFALGAGARFIARTIDTAQKTMPEILKRAHAHKGDELRRDLPELHRLQRRGVRRLHRQEGRARPPVPVSSTASRCCSPTAPRGSLRPATMTLTWSIRRRRHAASWSTTRPTGCWRSC